MSLFSSEQASVRIYSSGVGCLGRNPQMDELSLRAYARKGYTATHILIDVFENWLALVALLVDPVDARFVLPAR